MNTRHAVIETYLGPITVVAKAAAISGLYYEHHVRRPSQEMFGPEVGDGTDPLLNEAVGQLCDYLAGRRRDFDLPLEAEGDAFQRAVWDLVKSIQCGDTTTYGRIAEQVGDRALAQKVGQAVGANPLCIFVPCHRVVGSTGALTGYAGGLNRKQVLLALEEPSAGETGRLF
ncbi:methylated-DNA--[protein]-cysteine S-methyltransferase [Sinosporangium siamense]|uniref:methylated-DNA--[protein]-cysteine S-methyltransferase n=1 Tax=Sinosporangium siamense TaxID=1367973 RepID=A0A919RJ60_9ACTN|nr:methylated-DNA--[protein]-cysteine S-methyltransferase [Sinosporangium siamense]GII94242.1 methylated-DNA--protein-cysteine methyltransferase [Sinosporangium siamense]